MYRSERSDHFSSNASQKITSNSTYFRRTLGRLTSVDVCETTTADDQFPLGCFEPTKSSPKALRRYFTAILDASLWQIVVAISIIPPSLPLQSKLMTYQTKSGNQAFSESDDPCMNYTHTAIGNSTPLGHSRRNQMTSKHTSQCTAPFSRRIMQ